MSDDTPQPAEPDPFEQLLKGLSEPEDAAGAEAAGAEADALPPTAPMAPPTAPTIAMPGAVEAIPEPVSAQQPPSQSSPGWSLGDATAETAMYPAADPTAATAVLAGGRGQPPSGPGGPTRSGGPFGNRRLLLWILIGAAALLVLALAVLITVLAMNARGGEPAPTDTPAASDTPTPTGSMIPSDTPSPTPTVTPAIESFVADPMVVRCQDPSSVVTVQLGWSTVGATEVAVASSAALVDAIDKPYQNNLGPVVERFAIPYACGNPEWTYTLTIVGTDGEHRSSIVTVTRLPFPSPTPPPAPPAPSINDFSASAATVTCVEGEAAPTFDLEWASTNGTSAAIDGPGSDTGYDWPSLAANGHQPSIGYDCAQDAMTFTLTVTGKTAPPAKATVTVTNDGWVAAAG